jgi:membrane-associated HD superfamily phosphohydrolase
LSVKPKKAQGSRARWWPRPFNPRRLLIGLVTGAALSTLLTIQLLPDRVSLRIGQIAPEDIVAHKYAQYEDTAETTRMQRVAEQSVSSQYANDHGAPRLVEEEVRRLFAALRRSRNMATPPARLGEILKSELGHAYPVEATDAALRADPAAFQRLEPEALRLVRTTMARGIRDDTDDLPRARRALAAAVLTGRDTLPSPTAA